jgi:superfamily II DNA or RNA helicase
MGSRKISNPLVPGDWVIWRKPTAGRFGPYQVTDVSSDQIVVVSGAHPDPRVDLRISAKPNEVQKITDVSGLSLWFPRKNHKAWSHGVARAGGDDAWQIEVDGVSGIHRIPFRNHLLEDGYKALWVKDFQSQPNPIEMLRLGMASRIREMNVARSYRKWVNEQIQASVGFSAVMSAPIRPAHHQLNAMARVLGDPTLRFLLADEVGLGKTIEASLVLKQLLLDGAISSATIVVPRALKSQWVSELITKMSLQNWVSSGQVKVITHEELDTYLSTDLLIVDEAHRFCRGERSESSYSTLQFVAERVEKLLLISATPMRSDPYMLLQLLHLLDPRNYRLDDENSFRSRLEMRVRQSNALRLLKQNTSLEQRKYLVNALRANILDDSGLEILLSTIETVDNGSPDLSTAIDSLRTEIEERFRISRRLVRNRRSAIDLDDFPLSGRTHEMIPTVSKNSELLNDFLEEWRDRSKNSDWELLEPVFASLLENILGGCVSTRNWINSRLDDLSCSGVMPAFDTEKNLLEHFRVQIPETDHAPDFFSKYFESTLVKQVELNVAPQKTVLCTGSTERAREIFQVLYKKYGHRVVAHLETLSEDVNAESIQKFNTVDDARVLVIDGSAEEGLNLQVARTLINVDLPWSVNRLEQRFGRLDRFADGHVQDAVCKVLLDESNELMVYFVQFLLKATGIFDESVATAQQSLAKVLRQLTKEIWGKGVRHALLDYQEVKELIAQEKDEVEELEDIESQSSFGEFPESNFRNLQRFEEQWSDTKKVIDKITDSSGGLGIHRRTLNDSRIYGYTLPLESRIPSMLRDVVEPNLSKRATFHRVLALNNPGTEMLRIGNRMIDYIERFLLRDDLGRVSVGWVKDDAMVRPYIDFSIEVLVAPDFEFLRDLIPRSDFKRVQRRLGTSLQPQLMQLRLDENMNSLPSENHVWGSETRLTAGEDLIQVLERKGALHEALDLIEEKLPEIVMGQLENQIEIATVHARSDSDRRIGSMKIWHSGNVQEEIDLEEQIADELDHGLRNPIIKVLSLAAVVHSYEEF